ncbi:unnamed protein product [Allacma fusca]|uniref:Uncharacterized protein n=1 Tax=Allacma fusca TaxID=39272 RepID=A0A8J2LFH7_9HEXA|nr:unnamed protein product [Allacma fusca]
MSCTPAELIPSASSSYNPFEVKFQNKSEEGHHDKSKGLSSRKRGKGCELLLICPSRHSQCPHGQDH